MKWTSAPSNEAEAARLARGLRSFGIELTAPAARVLWARGYRDPEQARRFFSPRLSDLHDPFLLRDMETAVVRLRRAIEGKEKILLYGDYDADGASAIVILMKGIELAGGRASFHVPHRLRDGYGMQSEVVEQAAGSGVSLIISVDTGIRAHNVVRHAAALGIDVIVTDHHLPERELPPALAVLNPNRADCGYPDKNLCGAGVALKLAQALLDRSRLARDRRERILDSFLKLAAIATVADVVGLTGENRVIVKRGLEGLQRVKNAGLRALLDVSGFSDGQIPNAGDIAFRVAPRVNAAGRMAAASEVVEMFLTEDAARARELASKLHHLNQDRQQTEAEIARAIFDQCAEQPVTDSDAALVFAGKGWHRGVVGIVASRVAARFHRPAFVLGIENGVAQGSGRSIPRFHLLETLERMPDLFIKFGGHRQAAGVTLAAARLEEFRQRLREHAAALLTPADFEPELEIDAEIRPEEITDRAILDVLRLAPFGYGNPAPVFLAKQLELTEPPDVRKEKHLFLRFRSADRTLRIKAWNFAERAHEFIAGARLDVALQFEEDPYSAGRGYAPWQAILKDARPAAAAAGQA
ncbi:MAG TPA: single-stranded-DNA-specific exonuclease RecJ [Bryobacteraceae bacterium]|nr:single-stranded-DNA-specific exonuclease RecJ [Bryobacteraceae bacterium]